MKHLIIRPQNLGFPGETNGCPAPGPGCAIPPLLNAWSWGQVKLTGWETEATPSTLTDRNAAMLVTSSASIRKACLRDPNSCLASVKQGTKSEGRDLSISPRAGIGNTEIIAFIDWSSLTQSREVRLDTSKGCRQGDTSEKMLLTLWLLSSFPLPEQFSGPDTLGAPTSQFPEKVAYSGPANKRFKPWWQQAGFTVTLSQTSTRGLQYLPFVLYWAQQFTQKSDAYCLSFLACQPQNTHQLSFALQI